MLPLSLLRTAAGHPMLVELKNGETYNGELVACDNWMNISLRGVICTSRDGDRFWRLPEVTIRGNNIKYLRIPEEVIDMVPAEEDMAGAGGKGRGRGGDGRGRGGKGGKGEGKGGGRGGRGRGGDGAKGAGRAAGRGGRY
uniref:U6 snRNA-associated Sm-like protein LSm4 n=1 Tax=Haptolina brevifila TaxID=156173 RepID=A0A7S2CLJ6_9EUKA|mmetsp:Transcript_26419/g.53076  ORF Transcript_26419/g.53076 Transcript_26419/m.53076 type:complete len:140 (+) Transcript_26419:77-496(+)